jgi:hypothetical protein
MMKMLTRSIVVVLLLAAVPAIVRAVTPNPVLVFAGQTYRAASGKSYTRYHYFVFNAEEYPNAMFAASPDLPPCGANTKSSRTWIDLFDQTGKRLYGFCSIANADGLSDIWFDLAQDQVPPSWIYIEMNDRKSATKYKSNLAETVL